MKDISELVEAFFRRGKHVEERVEFWTRLASMIIVVSIVAAFMASWYGRLAEGHVIVGGIALIGIALLAIDLKIRPLFFGLVMSAILRRLGKKGVNADKTIRNKILLRIAFVPVVVPLLLGALLVACPIEDTAPALLFWVLGTLFLMLGTVAAPKTWARRLLWLVAILFVVGAGTYSAYTNEDAPMHNFVVGAGEYFDRDVVVVTSTSIVVIEAPPTTLAFDPTPMPEEEIPDGYYLYSWERIRLGTEYSREYGVDGPTDLLWGAKGNPVCDLENGVGFMVRFREGEEVPYLTGGPEPVPAEHGWWPPVAFKAVGNCPEVLLYVLAPQS